MLEFTEIVGAGEGRVAPPVTTFTAASLSRSYGNNAEAHIARLALTNCLGPRRDTPTFKAPSPAGSRAGHESMGAMLPKRWLRAPLLTAVQQVKLMAEREAGVSLAQFALAWVLRRQEVSSAIIGATRPEQVAENAAAAEYQIAPELFARAEDILAPMRQGPLAWEVARRFRSTAEAFVRRIFGARGRT